MRSIGITIGYIMTMGAGLLMFGFWLNALHDWWGIFGVIIGFLIAPGAVIFPLIFWIVEGVFPTFYFLVWGIGVIGMFIGGSSSEH